MLSGKILQPADWFRLFQAILDADIVEEAVLTVVSDHVSGSIGVRQGRWITGASTSTGLKGAGAVRQLISLPYAQFGYLDAQKVKVRAAINQNLHIDISELLSDPSTPIVDPEPPQEAMPPPVGAAPASMPPQQRQAPAEIPPPPPKAPTAAEVATSELRKTFNQLRPVPQYYETNVPPPPPPGAPASSGPKPGQSGIRPAIPPAPPKVVSPPPRPAAGSNAPSGNAAPSAANSPSGAGTTAGGVQFTWGDDDDGSSQPAAQQQAPQQPQHAWPQQAPPSQPPQAPPAPPRPEAGGGFEFDPSNIPNETGTGRKRVNPLDKLIYGAASTCMKLTSLKARREQEEAAAAAQQQSPWGAPAANDPPVPEPDAPQRQQPPGFAPPMDKPSEPYRHPAQERTEAEQPQRFAPPNQQQGFAPPNQQQGFAPPNQQQGFAPPNQQQGFAPPNQQQPNRQQPFGAPAQGQQSFPPQPHQQPQQQFSPPRQQNGPDYPTSEASPAPGPEAGYVHPHDQTRRSGQFNNPRIERAPEERRAPGPPPHPAPHVAQPIGPQQPISGAIPHTVAPPLDPAEARNLVDAVRATAWRLASRVAYEAKLRMEDDRPTTQRLRSIETATADSTESVKARRRLFPPDPVTLAFIVCVILGIGVLVGGFMLVQQQQGNRPYINTGKRYLSEGKDELAIGQFTLASEHDVHDPEPVQLRAETYEKMQDWEHASADYSKLWELKPKHYDAARKAAFYQFKLRHYDEGLKLARKLLGAKPDDASGRAQVVMNLSRAGQSQDAITESAQVDKDLVPPYLVSDYFGSMGAAFAQTGDLKHAIAFYTKALEADPKNELNLTERGGAFMKLKDYKKAAEDYRSITRIVPGHAGGYADYAKAAMLAGDPKTAAEQYETAIKLSPTVQYYVALAECDMANNNFGHAVYDCDCALKMQPTCFDAAHLRGIAMQKAKSEKAIVIAKITPDYIMRSVNAVAAQPAGSGGNAKVAGQDPWTQEGYKLLLAKNWKGAATTLAAAIKRTPRDWSARRFYAAANMELGSYAEALASFDVMQSNKAILPSDEMAWAESAAKAGKTDRALEIYNGMLNRDPTFLEARVAMIKLCKNAGYESKAQQLVKEGIAVQPVTKDMLTKALAGQ